MATKTVITPTSLGGLDIAPVADTLAFINMMNYGDPGAGKTRLAGSAEEVEQMRPVLFIDVEGGTFSLRHVYPTIDVVRVNSWRDMQMLYNELYDMKHGYKTVVLDSTSEIQKFSMLNIMTQLVRKEPDRDPEVPGLREWGKNIEQIRRLVRAFRDLPMHTIFTALAVTDKDKLGEVKTRPGLSGKLSAEVGGFVDILAYQYVKVIDGELVRLLSTAGTEKFMCKDRSDKLPPVIKNPTMQIIYDTIFPK